MENNQDKEKQDEKIFYVAYFAYSVWLYNERLFR